MTARKRTEKTAEAPQTVPPMEEWTVPDRSHQEKCEHCELGTHSACHGIEDHQQSYPTEKMCACHCRYAEEYRRYALNHVQAYRSEEVLHRPANAAVGRYVTPGDAPMSIVGDE